MKKRSFLLVISMLALLSACNQQTDNDKANKDETPQKSSESNDQKERSSATNEEHNDGQIADPHTDTLTASDEQDYQIQLLPNYSLTSEEPGKDALYATEDDAVFMRIETANDDGQSYDTFKSSLVELMEAISLDGWELEELSDSSYFPSGEQLSDPVAYKVATDDATIFGYLFRSGDLLVRLTVFDTADEQFIDHFIEMASTIQPK